MSMHTRDSTNVSVAMFLEPGLSSLLLKSFFASHVLCGLPGYSSARIFREEQLSDPVIFGG